MNRRKFINKSFLALTAALLTPVFLKSDIKAAPRIKLNFKPEPSKWNDNDLTIAWIGHSTILMNFFGKWILTDPVLFNSIGVYFFGGSIGPGRITPPALEINEIPKPDMILVSHAHMDHMDYPTLKAFAEKYPERIDLVVAYLNKDVINDLPWKSISVLDWNDEIEIQDTRIKANEVKHFGWRFPWEKDRSRGFMKDGRSYNAYLIERNGKKVL
ncbi:MAG: MBL fold metallo-hydrolase, partial [Melioribacteraceae bacterium]